MPGQKTVRGFLGPLLWSSAALGCAAPADRPALVVDVPEPGPHTESPQPPTEAPETTTAPARDPEVERAERESLVRASETVANLRPGIEQCFLAHSSGSKKRRVVVHFIVRISGRATGVTLEPNLGNSALKTCVRRAFRTVRFEPPAQDGMRMSVPLKLDVP
jgi:hypothetical protein